MRLNSKIISTIILLLGASIVHSQYVQPMRYDHYSVTRQMNVGSGTSRVTDPSAYLEIGPNTGGNKGLLLPRLFTSEMNAIPTPVNGLVIYNIDSVGLCVYNGILWKKVGSTDTANLSSRIDQRWSFSANSVSGNPVLGTSNNRSFNFVTNGIRRARIDSLGHFWIDSILRLDNYVYGIRDSVYRQPSISFGNKPIYMEPLTKTGAYNGARIKILDPGDTTNFAGFGFYYGDARHTEGMYSYTPEDIPFLFTTGRQGNRIRPLASISSSTGILAYRNITVKYDPVHNPVNPKLWLGYYMQGDDQPDGPGNAVNALRLRYDIGTGRSYIDGGTDGPGSNKYPLLLGADTGRINIGAERLDGGPGSMLWTGSSGQLRINRSTDPGSQFKLVTGGGVYQDFTGDTLRWVFGSDAAGDTYYRSANGHMKRLAAGSEGQVLKIVSGLPAWRDTASLLNFPDSVRRVSTNWQYRKNGTWVTFGTDSVGTTATVNAASGSGISLVNGSSQIKRLKAGTGISITDNTDSVTITNSGSGALAGQSDVSISSIAKGQMLAYDSAAGMWKNQFDNDRRQSVYEMWEDFVYYNGTGWDFFDMRVNGSGALSNRGTWASYDASLKRPGTAWLSTGTTNTGYGSIDQLTNGISGPYIKSGTITGEVEYSTSFTLNDASTGTDEYVVYQGLYDDGRSSEPGTGIYFKYDRANYGDSLILVCARAGTRSQVATTTMISTNAVDKWLGLKFIVNADGTSVRGYFKTETGNWTEVTAGSGTYPITTNIPNDGSTSFGPFSIIRKTAGTSSRNLHVDYVGVRQQILNGR